MVRGEVESLPITEKLNSDQVVESCEMRTLRKGDTLDKMGSVEAI